MAFRVENLNDVLKVCKNPPQNIEVTDSFKKEIEDGKFLPHVEANLIGPADISWIGFGFYFHDDNGARHRYGYIYKGDLNILQLI